MKIDFGKTAGDYGQHRAGFPDELFSRLANMGHGVPGQRVLDLGTGTGSLGRGFARAGCQVVGLDPARPLLTEARRLDRLEGLGSAYLAAHSEDVPLADAQFDIISAGQCWHWFDRPRTALELRRLLKPEGHVVIAHFDWLPLPGNVVEATERLIERFNPSWTMAGGVGMYPQWLLDLGTDGFTNLQSFTFDVHAPYTQEAWRGRIRASAGVSASLSPDKVAEFDEELRKLLIVRGEPEQMAIPHRVFVLIGQSPKETS